MRFVQLQRKSCDSTSRCGDQNRGILMTMKKGSALQFRSGHVLFQRQAPFLAQSLFLDGSAQPACPIPRLPVYAGPHVRLIWCFSRKGGLGAITYTRGVDEDSPLGQPHKYRPLCLVPIPKPDAQTYAVRPYTGFTPPPSLPVRNLWKRTVPTPQGTSLYW